MTLTSFPGIDLLATAVLLLDEQQLLRYINPAAENLLGLSNKNVVGHPFRQVFPDAEDLFAAAEHALAHAGSFTEHEMALSVAGGNGKLLASCTVTPAESEHIRLVIEFRQTDQQMKVAREERMLLQQQANRHLIRNLAHEIRNPLGGIRGAAQLLEHELVKVELREYTQVIIKECDRLQGLMDRLLTPHRLPKIARLNIHEVLERVRSLLLAETFAGVVIRRDYDTSLPEISGDKEQLIQVVLNITRNAVQALQDNGEVVLRTRVVRQATLAKRRHRLAIQLQIIDNGPGIPEALRERIFYPLVSGRDDGAGLGLTIAQTYINQHHGTIECDSRPGCTCFTTLLPLPDEA